MSSNDTVTDTGQRLQKATRLCRHVLRAVTPPIVAAGFSRVRQALRAAPLPEWEYMPRGWQTVNAPVYDDADVLAVQERQWNTFTENVQRKDWLSLPAMSLTEHNFFVTFAYVLARAARRQTRVSLLDYGGGLGRYCLAARQLLPEVEIEYHCRELPALARRGAQFLPEAQFYSDDACFERDYDMVLASSSLQYAPEWQPRLRLLCRATKHALLVTRQPFTDAGSYVFIQRPRSLGYRTEYLGWCLNKDEFLQTAAGYGMTLEREFTTGEAPSIQNAPGACRYFGFLLRPPHFEAH